MSDIRKIGNKYYDFGTKNKSFLTTAHELKTLGIKNWFFMLEVRYPNILVQDIDPYDPNIKPEEAARVAYECRANPWYFFREVLHIPVGGSDKPYQFELTRASAACIWCYDHNIDFALDQPRQTYKTTTCIGILVHGFLFVFKNLDIPVLHKKLASNEKNCTQIRDYVYALPSYLNPWFTFKKLPSPASLKYESHGTRILQMPSFNDEQTAEDSLRGFTIYMMLADEWEFIKFFKAMLNGATPAFESARRIAKESGQKHCLMWLSTPGNENTQFGKEAAKIVREMEKWTESFYDLTDAEIREIFVEGIDGLPITRVYIKYTYRQLRKNEAWLRQQYAECLRNDGIDEYRRGVLQLRYRGDGTNILFHDSDTRYIQEHVLSPDYDILLFKKWHLRIYKHEITNYDMFKDEKIQYFDSVLPYVIGIDCAAGTGRDNTAVIIVEPYSMKTVAELQSPYMGTNDLMELIIYFAQTIPKAVFCIEPNTIGKAVIDSIQRCNLVHRFYSDPKLGDISKNAIEYKSDMDKMLKQRAMAKRYIGIQVTPTTRNMMFSLFRDFVSQHKELINTEDLVDCMMHLVMNKDKIEAERGEHDDMVMAFNHVLYTLTFGSELERYGIHKEYFQWETPATMAKNYRENDNIIDTTATISDVYEPGGVNHALIEQIQHESAHVEYVKNPYAYNDPSIQKRFDEINQRTTYTQNEDVVEILSDADLAFFNKINGFGSYW